VQHLGALDGAPDHDHAVARARALAVAALEPVHVVPGHLKHAFVGRRAVPLWPGPLEECVKPHVRHGRRHRPCVGALGAPLQVDADVVGRDDDGLFRLEDGVGAGGFACQQLLWIFC